MMRMLMKQSADGKNSVRGKNPMKWNAASTNYGEAVMPIVKVAITSEL
jgi:hypothetical protein